MLSPYTKQSSGEFAVSSDITAGHPRRALAPAAYHLPVKFKRATIYMLVELKHKAQHSGYLTQNMRRLSTNTNGAAYAAKGKLIPLRMC